MVLDAEGLAKLAAGDRDARTWARRALDRNGTVVTAASTIAEVLSGGPRDAPLYRVLSSVTVVPIDQACGRTAGELLGTTGLSGHRCAMDALLAAVALRQSRPVIVLTSDPSDLAKLTEEPDRARSERIAVVAI